MKSITSLLAYVVVAVNFTIALPAVTKGEANLNDKFTLNLEEQDAIHEKYEIISHSSIEIGYENIKRIRLLLMAINSSIDLPEANSKYYDEIGLTVFSPEFLQGLIKGPELDYALRYFFRKDLEDHLDKIDLIIKKYDYLALIKIVQSVGDRSEISTDLFYEILGLFDALSDINSSHLSLVDDIYDDLGKSYGYDHYVHDDKAYGLNNARRVWLENVIMSYMDRFRYALITTTYGNFFRERYK